LRQKDADGEYIFGLEALKQIQSLKDDGDLKKRPELNNSLEAAQLRATQAVQLGDIEALERMKPFGVDQEGSTYFKGLGEDDRDWFPFGWITGDLEDEKLVSLRKKWSEKSEEVKSSDEYNAKGVTDYQKEQMIKDKFNQFAEQNPYLKTKLISAADAPEVPKPWTNEDWSEEGGVQRLLYHRYNQLKENHPEKMEQVDFRSFADTYNKEVAKQSELAKTTAQERAKSIRDGVISLYTGQTRWIGDLNTNLLTVGGGTVDEFDEVFATEHGRKLDGLFSPGQIKVFNAVKDKWNNLEIKPDGKDLETWLTNAATEAEGEIGDPHIYNIRSAINDTSKAFVPDFAEDVAGRAREKKTVEKGFWDYATDFGRVFNYINPFVGEEGVYKNWAAGEVAAGRTVPDYDEYRGIRDIMDERPPEDEEPGFGDSTPTIKSSGALQQRAHRDWNLKESLCAHQRPVGLGRLNEDLLREVVQEALKRKFGE